jgi:hypothetical protein
MADEEKNQSNIDTLKEKTKATEELSNATKRFKKEQQESNKATKKATELLKDRIAQEDAFTDILEKTTDGLKKLMKVNIAFSATGVATALIGTATKMIAINSELHRTVINAGKGVESLKAYKNASADLSISMGATFEEANKVVKKLAELQYLGTPGEIQNAAEASYGLARAFGLDHEAITANTVELQKWGQVSAKTTTAMYADIMKVAQANGLTKDAVNAITKTTTNWSGMLKAFGKTAPMDVQRYNMGLAKTVSALEKVGVSAQTATKLLEDLTDPTMIEENIPKYAALGISITDAISGNIDPEQMGAGLKEFGEKLKQMGPIAGAQYAKAMGVSYKDAIKAASADMAEASQVDMTPEEKSAEAIKQLTDATKDLPEKLSDGFQQIGGLFRKLGPEAMIVGGLFIGALSTKMFKMLNGVKEKITKTTEETKLEKLSAIKEEENTRLASLKKEAKTEEQQIKELIKQKADPKTAVELIKKKQKLELQENHRTVQQQFIEAKESAKKLNEKQIELEDKIRKTRDKSIKKLYEEEYQNNQKIIEKKKQDIDELFYKEKNARKKLSKFKEEATEKEIEKMTNDYQKLGGKLGSALAKGVKKVKLQVSATKAKVALQSLGKKWSSALKKVKLKVGSIPGMKALGGLAKSMGALAIVGTILGKIFGKFQEPLENLLDNVIGKLQPVFDVLMKVFTPLINTLVKAILPPVLKVLAALLKILNVLLTPIRKILEGLGHIPGLGFLKDVADSIGEVTSSKTTDALMEAADNIANSNEDLTKKTEENTEAVSEGNKKEQLTVSGNGQVVVSKAQTSSTESSKSTSSNTSSETAKSSTSTTSKEAEELKTIKEEIREMKNVINNYIQGLKENRGANESKVAEVAAGIQKALGMSSGDNVPITIEAIDPVIGFNSLAQIGRNLFNGKTT